MYSMPKVSAQLPMAIGFEHLSARSMITVRDNLERGFHGEALSREELIQLAALDEHGLEAGLLRATAQAITAQRFGNKAMLLVQAGMESHPCPADCAFCGFGQSHFQGLPQSMSEEELDRLVEEVAVTPGLYALFLMYMHTFEFEKVLRTVHSIRQRLPREQELVLNMGDMDATQALELQAAGATGAYHVLRLREGVDTRLSAVERQRSIEHIVDAGLHWYTCCEPIGPEHDAAELVDQILIGSHLHCFQHAAMRRVCVPDTPLASRGQVTSLRLAQMVAVVVMAMVGNPRLSSIAVHEPDMVGLTSGANCVYAELGGNPRDRECDTRQGRGNSLKQCKAMLSDAGYLGFL